MGRGGAWLSTACVACAIGSIGCGGRTGLPYGDVPPPDAGPDVDATIDARSDASIDVMLDGVEVEIDAPAIDACACTPGDVQETSDGCPTGETRRLRCAASCTWVEESPCGLHGWFPISAPTFVLEPRSQHGAIWTGKEMVIFGGTLDPEYPSIPDWTEGAAYDPASDTWRALPPSPYHPPSATWTRFSDIAPVAWTGSSLVALGRARDGPSVMAELSFTPGGEWRTITDLPDPELVNAVAVSLPATHEVIFFGGNHAPSAYALGWAWSAATRAWRALSASPLSPRMHPTATVAGGRMIVFGGLSWSGWPLADGAAYDPITDRWTPLATPPTGSAIPPPVDGGLGPPGAWRQGVVADDVPTTSAIFFGGSVAPSPYFGARVWSGGGAWDVASATWSIVPPADAVLSEPARDRGVVWSTDSRLFVWGGLAAPGSTAPEGDAHPSDTGAVYDRSTGAWAPMLPGGPSPRFDCTAVWTGSEAIVWGGEGPSGEKIGDGMAYRP